MFIFLPSVMHQAPTPPAPLYTIPVFIVPIVSIRSFLTVDHLFLVQMAAHGRFDVYAFWLRDLSDQWPDVQTLVYCVLSCINPWMVDVREVVAAHVSLRRQE
jgi:hypothetical protein